MNNGNSTQTHGATPLTRLEKGLLALVCLVLMCPLSLPAAVTASLHDNPADTGQIPSRRRVRHTEETTPQKTGNDLHPRGRGIHGPHSPRRAGGKR